MSLLDNIDFIPADEHPFGEVSPILRDDVILDEDSLELLSPRRTPAATVIKLSILLFFVDP